MKIDPRTKRFFELQKRDRSQLNTQELAEYLEYCKMMIDYARNNKKARGHWIAIRKVTEDMLATRLQSET